MNLKLYMLARTTRSMILGAMSIILGGFTMVSFPSFPLGVKIVRSFKKAVLKKRV